MSASSVPISTKSNARRSSPPPPSLERKFELLEARFTQPIEILGKTATNGFTSPGNGSSQQQNRGFGVSHENSNLSEHSFSFSGSRSNHSQPTMNIRSKRNRSMTNLDIVNRAAAEHIRKVASASPVNTGLGVTTALGTSNFSFSSNSHNSNSQQTVVTGNRTHSTTNMHSSEKQQQGEPQQSHLQSNPPPKADRVVAESPPVLISPAKASTATKPNVARALKITNGNERDEQQAQTQSKSVSSATKRKSVPKRKVSSIQDTIGGQSPVKSIASMSTSTSANTNGTGSLESRSPRPNHFLSEQSRDRSNSNHAGTSNKRPKVLLPPANNKRIHDFFSSSKRKTPASTSHAGKLGSTQNNGSTNTNGTVQNGTHFNIKNQTTQHNKAASDASKKRNNTASTSSSSTGATGSSSKDSDIAASLLAQKVATEKWQAKCAKLEQQLQDKDEQLKAVAGNKTILHTALQQALTKSRSELKALQTSSTLKIQSLHDILEENLRWKFEKQAKELRETLSANGNRLGKIVSTRAGMRVIDTWEEGYASKDWQLRRDRWKQRHKQLVEKQDKLKKRLREQKQNQDPKNQSEENPSLITEPIMSKLEIEEAQEAIQMHLESLVREEKELLAEEQSLNDEKGAHIRALKRVASEDASRFKNRAKLHDRYVLDCLLGKGGFSEVWKGYDMKELREVAVKIHQLDPRWPDMKKENYTKHVSREYEIHRNVRHCRIVSLYDVFEIDNNSFATVLECCKGTDLDTLLKRKKRLPERQARAILLQILSGMKYLSQPCADGSRQGIIHYDLKPGNILFDEFGDAKITDFGLSKIVDAPDPAESMELTSQGAGTYWYLPPECFVTGEQVRISNKVDVWSIGVIFYQMLYGQRPFGEGKSQDKLLSDHTMLNAQEVHLPEKPAISDAGKEFIKQCLMYDQAFRPTIAQLCENPYVLQKGV